MIFVQAIKYVAFLGLFCAISVQSLHAQQPRKIALIVGVSEYKKDGLENLKYAHKDAKDLAAALGRDNGFEVMLLTQKEAPDAEFRAQRTRVQG